MSKRISILGSTGSIGVNALKVSSHLKDELDIIYLSANRNAKLLIQQAKEFQPKAICIVDESAFSDVQNALMHLDIEILTGRESLLELAARDNVDILLNGLVGTPGMEPTYKAIEAGIDVALSNKESLVMAGDIIQKAMDKSGAKLFPVDSEHSAIWQCLVGENIDDVRCLILTGSGGPFRTRDITTFDNITVEEALNHPNWDMGRKITIDSATMMNKGLEFIEACWLFDARPDQVEVLLHPESVVHSMVEYIDGSVVAQMGNPDMRTPIAYGLGWPDRVESGVPLLDLVKTGGLHFEEPDLQRFPALALSRQAMETGKSASIVLNAANEVAVEAFLNERIRFTEITEVIDDVLQASEWILPDSIDIVLSVDEDARRRAQECVNKLK